MPITASEILTATRTEYTLKPFDVGLIFWKFKRRKDRAEWERARDALDQAFAKLYGVSAYALPLTEVEQKAGSYAALKVLDYAIGLLNVTLPG